MVDLTKTAAEILIPTPAANIKTADMVVLFEEIEAAVDRAYLMPPAPTGATLSVTAADAQKLFTFSGVAAVSLPEAGDLPAGFALRIKAGAGAVTITPFSGETVGGAGSLVLQPSESAELFGDGSGDWATIVTAGLGTLGAAATRGVGTTAGDLVEVLSGGRLPALDGSLLSRTPGALLFVLEDQKSQNTNAQTVGTANSWITRDLNTEVLDNGGVVSIASNQFTPTVNCEIEWVCPGQDVAHQSRCYDVTGSSVVELGTTATGSHGGHSTGIAQLTAGRTYRIEQNFNTTGFRAGVAANRATEVYTRVVGRAR